DPERRAGERTFVSASVLKVALDAHRSKQEQADLDAGRAGARRVGDERILEHAGPACSPDAGAPRVVPSESGGEAARASDREADALVESVREEVDGAAALAIDIDLYRVAGRVAKEACLVALIRRGVVDAAFGEGEHGRRRRCGGGELRHEHDPKQRHSASPCAARDCGGGLVLGWWGEGSG